MYKGREKYNFSCKKYPTHKITVYFNDFFGKRLRVRCVNIDNMINELVESTIESGKNCVKCRHGGSVCNSYGYRASTECALMYSFIDGNDIKIVVWCCSIPANKVTLGGAANNCLGGARPIFDYRYGDESTKEAKKFVHKEAKLVIEQIELIVA